MMDDAVDICLTRQPLDSAAAVARVTCPEAGGVALFLGTTRAEASPEKEGAISGALVSLDYHAYDEMAVRQIRQLAAAAGERWPVQRVVVWHRIGEVHVGEPSVIIAVSCPHRGEAFAACQYLIDALKKSVPIWKQEVYQRAARWQGSGQ